MSDKTARKWKKEKKRSLAEKVTIMSVAGALTIGFIGLIVGLYIYSPTINPINPIVRAPATDMIVTFSASDRFFSFFHFLAVLSDICP